MITEKIKSLFEKFFGSSSYVRWSILIGVTIVFTILLYPNLVIKTHIYKLGDVAEKDVKATKDFLIQDNDSTEAKRREAVDMILTVYDHDTGLAANISHNVKTAFGNLRAVAETEKDSQIRNTSETTQTVTAQSEDSKKLIHENIWKMKNDFEEKIGITVSDGAYKILENESFSETIADFITRITTEILDNGVVTNKELLLREIDQGIVLRDIETKTEKNVNKLKLFYGLDQAQTMVRIIGQPLLKNKNYTIKNLIVDFAQKLIQPNITLNKSETEERKHKAALEIKPSLYKIKAGEMLLREGERVTKIQLLKLQTSQDRMQNEQMLASSIGAAMIIFSILVMTYILHFKHQNQSDRNQNKNLLFIASVLITFFFHCQNISIFI